MAVTKTDYANLALSQTFTFNMSTAKVMQQRLF